MQIAEEEESKHTVGICMPPSLTLHPVPTLCIVCSGPLRLTS